MADPILPGDKRPGPLDGVVVADFSRVLAGPYATIRKGLAVTREARDMLGGNGLLLENKVARHVTDMEVISTYEGTDSVQALIVGREITGISAFTRKVRPKN